MKSSSAKFVSALFATVLAGSPLFAAPETEEKEKPADTCLLGPSASTPPGGHWYYRIDRVNKRNCWYLGEAKGEAKGKAARKQVAEEEAAAPEKPVAPPKKPAASRSVTDAHAEWSSQTPVEPESKAAAAPWPTVTPADAPRADEPRKVATTRWPEPAAASPVAAAVAAAPPAPSSAQTPPQVAPSQPQIAQAQPQAPTQATPVAPPPRPAAPPPAAKPTIAKANAAADQPMSLPMLLTVLVAGLSVIGVLVSAMFGRKKSRPTQLSRSAPMPSLEDVPGNPHPQPQQPRPDPARSEQARPEQPRPEQPRPKQPDPELAQAPDDPVERLKEMLAEIQRRAAA